MFRGGSFTDGYIGINQQFKTFYPAETKTGPANDDNQGTE
jgi:hypothetical protein